VSDNRPPAERPSLADLAPVLQAEFPVQQQPSTPTQDGQLFVDLGADQRDRPRRLELMFLPHGDDLYFLQLFVLLPPPLLPEFAGELARVLLLINANLPLPGFGMQEAEGWVYFRCIVPCGNRKLDPNIDGEAILATTWVASYQLDQFGEVIEDVAGGACTAADATTRVAALANPISA